VRIGSSQQTKPVSTFVVTQGVLAGLQSAALVPLAQDLALFVAQVIACTMAVQKFYVVSMKQGVVRRACRRTVGSVGQTGGTIRASM
jgi:hypothetical protein